MAGVVIVYSSKGSYVTPNYIVLSPVGAVTSVISMRGIKIRPCQQ